MPGIPRDVKQEEAIRAPVRAGGIEDSRRGKGSHRRVTMPNRVKLTIPGGTLRPGTLGQIIRNSGLTVEEFVDLL